MPIGAVLVSGDIVLEARNEKETRRDATAHAEMLFCVRPRSVLALGVWAMRRSM